MHVYYIIQKLDLDCILSYFHLNYISTYTASTYLHVIYLLYSSQCYLLKEKKTVNNEFLAYITEKEKKSRKK